MRREQQRRAAKLALKAARRAGCVCRPIVEHRNALEVVLSHDWHCPLIASIEGPRSPNWTQIVIGEVNR